MNRKMLLSAATALSAAFVSLAFMMPAHAQKAALTRDVDRPTGQPVSGTCNYDAACPLYTVPAGKRLVVETVSYLVTANSGASVDNLVFGQIPSGGVLYPTFGPNIYSVTPMLYADSGGLRTWGGTQPLRAYFDEHQVFGAEVFRSNVTEGGDKKPIFVFSGYLVDK